LDIAGIVDRACPMHHHKYLTHGEVVEFLLLHLVQHPDREPLYQMQEWAADHNVGQLWGCPADAFNDDRLGDALEAVAGKAQEIHAAVVAAVLQQYPIDPAVLHWDLTHVAFTDARRETELVRAGYGDGQVHERQVKLGLHVTSDCSLPIAYELLPGNAQQQPRAKPLLQELQHRLQRQDLTIVTDRGGISYDIIADYKQADAHFVSCLQLTPAQRKQVAALPLSAFEEATYRSKKQPDQRYWFHATVLEYTHQKRCGPLAVRALVVHSEHKQQSDHQQRQDRIASTLARLQHTSEQLNRRRFASGAYARRILNKKIPQDLAEIVRYELNGPDGELALKTFVDPQALAEAEKLNGRYVLVYELPGQAGGEQAFKLYKRQYLVESRFRNFRTDLAVNPVWLHKDERIAALTLVYVLALTLLCLLGLGADRAGLEGDYYHRMTPQAMLRRFTHLQAVLIQTRGQPAQIEIELTPGQSEVLRALNLPDPQRYLHPSDQA
jgi:transposase